MRVISFQDIQQSEVRMQLSSNSDLRIFIDDYTDNSNPQPVKASLLLTVNQARLMIAGLEDLIEAAEDR